MTVLEFLTAKATAASGQERKFILEQVAELQKKADKQALYDEHAEIKKTFSWQLIGFLKVDSHSAFEACQIGARQLQRFVELDNLLYKGESIIPKHLLILTLFGSEELAKNFNPANKKEVASWFSSDQYQIFWEFLMQCREEEVTSVLLPQLPIACVKENSTNIHIPNLKHIGTDAVEDFSYKYKLQEALALRLLSEKPVTAEDVVTVREFCTRTGISVSDDIIRALPRALAAPSDELFQCLNIPTSPEKRSAYAYEILEILHTNHEMSGFWKKFVAENSASRRAYHRESDSYKLCAFMIKHPEYIADIKKALGMDFEPMLGRALLPAIGIGLGKVNWKGVEALLQEKFLVAQLKPRQGLTVLNKVIENPPTLEQLKNLLSKDASDKPIRKIVGLFALHSRRASVLKLIRLSSSLMAKFIETSITHLTSKTQVEELCKLVPKYADSIKSEVARTILASLPYKNEEPPTKETLRLAWRDKLETTSPGQAHLLTDKNTTLELQFEYLTELFPLLRPKLTNSYLRTIVKANLDSVLPIEDKDLTSPELLKFGTAYNIERLLKAANPTEAQINALIISKIEEKDISCLNELLRLGIKFPENATHAIFETCEKGRYTTQATNLSSYATVLLALAELEKPTLTAQELKAVANHTDLLLGYIKAKVIPADISIDGKKVLKHFTNNFAALKILMEFGQNPMEDWSPLEQVTPSMERTIESIIAAYVVKEELTTTTIEPVGPAEMDLF